MFGPLQEAKTTVGLWLLAKDQTTNNQNKQLGLYALVNNQNTKICSAEMRQSNEQNATNEPGEMSSKTNENRLLSIREQIEDATRRANQAKRPKLTNRANQASRAN